MVKYFFSHPAALRRLHAGPLGPHIDAFAAQLSAQGYARLTTARKIALVADLSHWLDRRRLGIEELNEERILTFRRERSKCHSESGSDCKTLRDLLKLLRDLGIVAPPAAKNEKDVFHQVEEQYERYLALERGLARGTITYSLRVARAFLEQRYGKGPVTLADLTPKDVTNFMLGQLRAQAPASAQKTTVFLRRFFRFLYQRGEIAANLAAVIPVAANWRHAGVPKFLEPDEVERLLSSCDQNSLTGQRDYAILLLLARLGLRGGEIANMELDDIDWESGEILVHGKSTRVDRLPIPQDVGKALAAYLRYARPRCASRRVFIRVLAPHQGFASAVAVCNIVGVGLLRAGLNPDFKGAGLLRHSLATHMFCKGNSLAEIGEILRHQDPCTTEIYVKVNLAALRALAQPWKGDRI